MKQMSNVKAFPLASEYMDLQSKMKVGLTLKGKPRAQLLWRKYGQKTLHENKDLSQGGVKRRYYRCSMQDCGARLKVDVVRTPNGQESYCSVLPSGAHNHSIELVG